MAETKAKIALYRKYRPQNFANLVGQSSIQGTLLNALKSSKASHAYLFCGPRGTGKTSTARLIAKGLNCLKLSKEGEPCDKCQNCLDITAGRMIDVIEIDAASNRGVDEIRELREKVRFSPSQGQKKVFIIDEVHMLTKEAFNALLKTLEEPPEHAYFVLATTEIHKVPSTIISRCQRFDFKRITPEVTAERLSFIAEKENIKTEKEALDLIAKACDGSLRDAITLFEQMVTKKGITFEHVEQNLGLVKQQVVEEFTNLLLEKNSKAAISLINKIYLDGIDLKQFTKATLERIREQMMSKISEGEPETGQELLRLIGSLQESLLRAKNSEIPQLPLEVAVLEICLAGKKPVKKEVEEATENKEVGNEDNAVKKEDEVKKIKKESDLTLAQVKQRWGKVLDTIKNPTAKLALKKARLDSLEQGSLTLTLFSKFEISKLKENVGFHELEETISEVTGQKTAVKCKYEAPPQEADNTEALVEEALKIFGTDS